MKTYLMTSEQWGEFLCEGTDEEDAIRRASDWFGDFELCYEVSDYEAEMLGYDTY